MAKIALIIYGPPGSGKGTQANLAADRLGLIHFDTGKFLESVVHDPANAKDAMIKHEKMLFDTGKLLTPAWVFKMVKKKTEEISKANFGIVFSGSPRTLPEAKGLVPVLIRRYGKKNIFPVILKVTPATSIKRNSNRLLCAFCGMTILNTLIAKKNGLKFCVFCGGSFRRRTLDAVEVIKVRLKEYEERTKPIFQFLRTQGFNPIEISGEPVPYKVFENILRKVTSKMN